MARTAAEIQAEDDALKAQGVHHSSRQRVALRAELKALEAPAVAETTAASIEVQVPPIAAKAPRVATDDMALLNEIVARQVVAFMDKNPTSKVSNQYDRIKAALNLKHIFEDALGLVSPHRITLPAWETLGRESDTGEPFKPGENQAIVDGLQQRGMPENRHAKKDPKPSITLPDGSPIPFKRSRTLNEPDEVASFVSGDGDFGAETE